MANLKKTENSRKQTFLLRFLGGVERVGNRLPPPPLIFIWLCAILIVISGIGGLMNWSATGMVLNTSTKELEETTIGVVSLFSWDGLAYMLTKMVNNFTTFTSVGYTCTIMLSWLGMRLERGWARPSTRKPTGFGIPPVWWAAMPPLRRQVCYWD